jgi:hypothetical protein
MHAHYRKVKKLNYKGKASSHSRDIRWINQVMEANIINKGTNWNLHHEEASDSWEYFYEMGCLTVKVIGNTEKLCQTEKG